MAALDHLRVTYNVKVPRKKKALGEFLEALLVVDGTISKSAAIVEKAPNGWFKKSFSIDVEFKYNEEALIFSAMSGVPLGERLK